MTVIEALSNFHFLRPLWLLMMLPALLLVYLLIKQKSRSGNWDTIIDQQLLSYLSDGIQQRQSRLPLYGLGIAWLITTVALAGPSWNKLPQPVHQKHDALVIVLDLSLSMLAEDIKPSRLVRARHKILDIVDQRSEGLTALIAYSGDAHIVTPLTDDTPTISNLVPALSPLMMPVIGSDPVSALQEAKAIFHNAGIAEGRVLLITDGITTDDLDRIDDQLSKQGLQLSIMGVGTSDGAPIPADSGFLKDNNGNIIVPKLDRAPLEKLAANNGGRYADIALNSRDIDFLLPAVTGDLTNNTVLTKREFDQWKDRGPLLAMLLLPFALSAFRRGWLLTLLVAVCFTPQPGQAFEWQDLSWKNLWKTPDQRASELLQAGETEQAATTFNDPDWKASAYYRAEDYEAAARHFAANSSAEGHYNRGNALARVGKLEEAIQAYEAALQQNPELEDASYNKTLVENLLQQQKEQQQQQNGDNSEDGEQGQQQNSQQQDQQQSSNQQNQQQSGDSGSSQQNDSQQNNQQQQADNADPSAEEQNSSQQPAEPQTGEEQNASQQQSQSAASEKQDEDAQQMSEANREQSSEDAQSAQQRLATEQWLRQIPDDPSGLLRRKFQHESMQRQQRGETQREQPTW